MSNGADTNMWATLSAVTSLVHLPKELFQREWIPAWYPLEWLPIAANGTATVTVTIADDADFVALGGNYTASGVGAANEGTFTSPAAYTINIKATAQLSLIGQQGSNTGTTHINNMLRNGTNGPPTWAIALLAGRKTTMAATLTNLDNTQRNVRASLIGFHVY